MGKIEELLFTKGIYDCAILNLDDINEMRKFFGKGGDAPKSISSLCIGCGDKSVFSPPYCSTSEGIASVDYCQRMNVDDNIVFNHYINRFYNLTFICSRDKKHFIIFYLFVKNNIVIKIGQYPSISDFNFVERSKYKSVLKGFYKELNRAIGLFSHGIGNGSFVYLRRIIEFLIIDIYTKNSENLSISREDFVEQDYNERIETLKEFLPKIFVRNKDVFGVLSKGIHELSEIECLSIFPKILIGIELILDDLLFNKEKLEKEKDFRKSLQKINTEQDD